ncbi:MAG: transposase, partial [Bdellovibrionales bacterium]
MYADGVILIQSAAQKEMLDAALRFISEGANVMLVADRFYGTAALIGWCQKADWQYRIRLKSNLTIGHEGGEIRTGEAVKLCPEGVVDAQLYGSGVRTNIGFLHEK